MMRRRRPGRSKFPAFILGLAGILICVTCMSAETLLVILSLLLIALGVWKLVNAGNEGSVFITHTCFLQGRNSPDEEWKTIDELSDNKKNTVVRQFKPTSVRYVRLLVTQSTQNNSLKAARIYELEVY